MGPDLRHRLGIERGATALVVADTGDAGLDLLEQVTGRVIQCVIDIYRVLSELRRCAHLE